ncbi:MAG TPA: SAF domain-containing protein [Actinomycetota bacterium]|nr:SAF domain-containing protein [Actinomycetota bacterium]
MVIDSWQLQRRWMRLQRPLAAALILIGGLLLWARDNVGAGSVPAVVARQDVPAGSVVQPQDVQVVAWPADSHPPPAAASLDQIVGRRATSAITTGEPLTPQRVAGPGALAELGTDRVAVALPADPMASSGLVRPGDSVTLVGQSPTGPRTLTTAAAVLTVSAESGTIVAVPASAAASVVAAAATDSIAMVLLPAA